MDTADKESIGGEAASDEAQKYSKLFVFSGDNKAGMQGMDKEKQAQIIFEMSKNSSYFKRMKELDAVNDAKVEAMQKSLAQLSETEVRRLQTQAQAKLTELETRRSFHRICCVLDMDMFYAAVEIRDQPSLASLPVAVGGEGMICTSNYIARQYGVRAAMPGFIAKKLCPGLVLIPPRFEAYGEVSEKVRGVVGQYTSLMYCPSLDEVYFDLTDAIKHRLSPDQETSWEVLCRETWGMLEEIRALICNATGGLTCSAGIANNFMLAKIFADVNKPNGQFCLGIGGKGDGAGGTVGMGGTGGSIVGSDRRGKIAKFVGGLKVRKIGGVGKVTEKLLEGLGIEKVEEVRLCAYKILHCLSPSLSSFLLRASLGIGEGEGERRADQPLPPLACDSRRKSIGCERTYQARGLGSLSELLGKLKELAQSLGEEMEREGLRGHRLTIKVKDTLFRLHTKCLVSPRWFQSPPSIYEGAEQLLRSIGGEGTGGWGTMRVRLLGVSVSLLEGSEEEGELRDGEVGAMQRRMKKFLQKREAGEKRKREGEAEDEGRHLGEVEGEYEEKRGEEVGEEEQGCEGVAEEELREKDNNGLSFEGDDDVIYLGGEESNCSLSFSRPPFPPSSREPHPPPTTSSEREYENSSPPIQLACPCCGKDKGSLLELNLHLDRDHGPASSKRKKSIASFFSTKASK